MSTSVPKVDDKKKALSGKERREAALRQQQRQQQILLLVFGVGLLVGVVALILWAVGQSASTTVEIDAKIKTAYTASVAKGYGTTPEGFYYVGAADAPVVLEEVSSFSCPHCRDYHEQALKNIHDKIEAGQVKLVYVPVTTYGPFDSTTMTKAAMCSGEQGKFWEMHDIMFEFQGTYGTAAADEPRLFSAARWLGLDEAKFTACYNGEAVKQVIAKGAAVAKDRQVEGTPTIFLNSVKLQTQGGGIPGLNELRGSIEAVVNKPS
jgi:protein-disulfide isomerase